MDRPNIVYIHSHDTGRFVQPYGHAIATPHIQRLAEQGVLFRQAFCVNPTCSPSRASLLTGECPHNNGMLGLAHRGFALNDASRHLATTLRNAGYETGVLGQQHLRYVDGREEMRGLGYERVLDEEKTEGESIGQAAGRFISEKHNRPFFLSVGFYETHRAFPETLDAGDDPRYTLPLTQLPDTPEVRQDVAAFKTLARQLDAGMGEVFRAIEEAGLSDETLIICTTDHGVAFPFMKCNLTDGGIGVMLILRGPGDFGGGKVIDAMVSQLDIFPTLCDWLKIDAPAWLQGVSLLPLLRGETVQAHEELFAEVNYHAAYEPMRSVRTNRWKYIRRYDARPGPVLANCDDSPTKEALLAQGWADRAPADEQLYDLVFDPQEMNNLAGVKEMDAVVREMRGRLEAWMRRTDDPLLRGPVPLPAGAVVNGRDQRSASEVVSRII